MWLKLYRHLRFLRDVLIVSLTAFGGPNAHIALFLDILVSRRNYLNEKELLELMALCQMLPGPTSTQTITAIGYKRGGPILAFFTLMVWALPAVMLMSLLALLFGYFYKKGSNIDFFKYIQPMAVGFITYAAVAISKKVIRNAVTVYLLIISAAVTIVINQPWIFPVIIIFGGLFTNFTSKENPEPSQYRKKPNWIYLVLYIAIFLGVGLVALFTTYKPVVLFENFYRFGSLVFGGGQVLIPLMLEQFTAHQQYLTEQEFLVGYGMVQAVPGPVFSFCAFAGGMAMQDFGSGFSLIGSLIGTVGIFLPGTLLIFFVYPLWEYLKQFRIVTRSLEGINAAAAGLVVAAVFLMFNTLTINWDNLAVRDFVTMAIVPSTFALLMFTKIPAPIIVVAALLFGLFL